MKIIKSFGVSLSVSFEDKSKISAKLAIWVHITGSAFESLPLTKIQGECCVIVV